MYLNRPRRAVVFSFDEKTQCQAMDRTQPSLPMVPGRAGTMTHDYKRNGTTDLFAAMNVATGEVLTRCQKGHTSKDVLRFFKQIDASDPRGLAVHVITGNLSAHKTSETAKWLAHRDRRRWHLHFTPTSSSWTNLIELEDAIQLWTSRWKQDPTPFIWKATAADIIDKVQRRRATLNRQINSKTNRYAPHAGPTKSRGHIVQTTSNSRRARPPCRIGGGRCNHRHAIGDPEPAAHF